MKTPTPAYEVNFVKKYEDRRPRLIARLMVEGFEQVSHVKTETSRYQQIVDFAARYGHDFDVEMRPMKPEEQQDAHALLDRLAVHTDTGGLRLRPEDRFTARVIGPLL